MCGIVGYIGKKQAFPILIDGLKRLEYRGYDSAGVCVLENDTAFCVRSPGRILKLEEKIGDVAVSGSVGIAHTRWATHGQPNEANAHPHADCTGTIFVAHNGIIENYRELRDMLEKEGHVFSSETDTETLAHLIERYDLTMVLEDAVSQALELISGTFGLAVVSLSEPQKIVVARRSSPLLIGIGEGEYLVASDASAVIAHTKEVVYLNDDEIAVLTPDAWKLRTLDRRALTRSSEILEWSHEEAERGGYPFFMAKEIHEAPLAVENALRGRIVFEEGNAKLGGLEDIADTLRAVKRLIIVSCGTSYYAGLSGAMMIEEYAGIPVEVYNASEFRYRAIPFNEGTVVLAISQSGETADTLAAIREAKKKGLLSLGIVNVVGSSIARETDAGIYNHAGPEIGVASTKAFISQLTVLALLAVYLGRMRGMSFETGQEILRELKGLPACLERILKKENAIKALAEIYTGFENFFFIGRRYQYPTALEGALKLKEISYIHSEGYAAGEMKHGPIALISKKFPTVAMALTDSMYEKMISNIQEIKARKGPIIAIANEGNENIKNITQDVIYIPKTLEMLMPILAVVPLQLFAYHVAVLRGCDVDKPRNLAKSVTVE
ncbi:MAG: glutamine--fructose-6-phosphate transaminase (isomerizing) [bacterium]|nr:glutamine--fructose-6-phosphate transaminase (isomerizing) [bacterium]